jgi:aliphatic nitrilase
MAMGDRWPTVRIAAVQAAPAFLDREASLAKAVDLIGKAAAGRAELVVFPEGFIPAHPVWYHFHAATSRASLQMARELVDNAVEIPSPATDALCRAARLHRVYAVVGLCERDPVDPGLLYNTQLFLGPEGEILGRHRKLMPTVGERLVHAPGFGDTLRVVPTRFGPVGGLICGEASNPLAVMSLASQGARIIAVSWPNHFSRNEHRMRDIIQVASRALGYRANCYVVSAAGVVSEEMRRRLPSSEEDAAFLSLPGVGGGTLVADPHGNVVAGPLGDGEDILAVSADLGEVVSAKLVHDYAGHYNRPEVFTLLVRTDHPQLFRAVAEGAPSRADPAWPAPGQIAETRARPVPAAETDGRSAQAPEAVPVRVAAE